MKFMLKILQSKRKLRPPTASQRPREFTYKFKAAKLTIRNNEPLRIFQPS